MKKPIARPNGKKLPTGVIDEPDRDAPRSQKEVRRQNQQAILEAAEVVFAQEGYGGASVGRIAELAGLPRANVLYYFDTKENLYKQVLYSMCLAWEGPADEFSKYSDPAKVMRNFIRAKMILARQRPYGSKVWVGEVLRGAQMLDDYLRDHLKGWLEEKSAVVRHWISLGLIEPIDPKTMFYSIWATTQHYADFSDQLKVLNNDVPYSDEEYENIIDDLVGLYLRGLGLVERRKPVARRARVS